MWVLGKHVYCHDLYGGRGPRGRRWVVPHSKRGHQIFRNSAPSNAIRDCLETEINCTLARGGIAAACHILTTKLRQFFKISISFELRNSFSFCVLCWVAAQKLVCFSCFPAVPWTAALPLERPYLFHQILSSCAKKRKLRLKTRGITCKKRELRRSWRSGNPNFRAVLLRVTGALVYICGPLEVFWGVSCLFDSISTLIWSSGTKNWIPFLNQG